MLGNSANYYSCLRFSDGGTYITKIIEKDLLTLQQKLIFYRETYMVRKVNHPNV